MDLTVRKLYRETSIYGGKEVRLRGWIRNNRAQKSFGFIDLHDGSFFKTIQVVYESEHLDEFLEVSKYRVGSCIEVSGVVELTPEGKQPFEIKAKAVKLLGPSEEDFPIQPKRHSREFLREVSHLRPRTNLFNAVFRVRSLIAHAIHSFFQELDFVYVHTPIITGNDGEGAGEMFRVTTLDLNNVPKIDKEVDYKQDFFQIPANLTVTGQLHVEAYTAAFRNCYTFGPTFRAENSNTKIHAAEFWMIEPEIAFADINDNMELAEDMIKYVIKYILDRAPEEMEFFNKFVEKGLLDKLNKVLESKFVKVTHKEAINILQEANKKNTSFENLPTQGEDLATEHEKYLVEHFNGPVYVVDWPKDIKAFYMRLNDDNETVAAMDLLVPGAGELVGGSQREERYDKLLKRMEEMNVPQEELSWYLDLRKYGGYIHSGYGIGFERLVMYITGIENIRDVVPFPRTVKNCEY
ncbi:asparagine--tRNA ligase [Mycoplasmatota bacterium]|nr:asparagine--tRNA ligase [Mycoplasmatota bacterium]